MATKILPYAVFPSSNNTIMVEDDDTYGGAHTYKAFDCAGFNNGKTEYLPTTQTIQFVKKEDDGSMIPGFQNEQLVYILIDRTKKLNARFPSKFNEKMLEGLQMYLDAAQARIEERLSRGVMGELKQ